jgi:1-acyl-sn-glycerol-3-phosphate acyltransferase
MRVGGLASELYRYTATVQGWLLVAALTLLFGVALIPPTLLLSPVWPGARDVFSDLTHRALRFYIRSVMYMRIGVEGAERRLPGTCVLVANHQSWLDPLVLMGLEPRLAGPARRYMLRVPIFGAIVRLAGFFQSDIGELPSLDDVRRSVETARARGGSLLFFPEGTRSQNGEVGAFHRGAFRTAFDHGLPIQPVVIEGLDCVLPRKGPIVQTYGRHLVRVRYLEPIAPPFETDGTGLRRDIVRGLTDQTRGAIAEELAKMRAERGTAMSPER